MEPLRRLFGLVSDDARDAVVRAGADRGRPFDLVRSFSVLSLVCIALVAAVAALALSRLLTSQMLTRDAEVSAEFLNSIVRAEKTWADLLRPGPGPGRSPDSFFGHIAHLPDVVRANVFARDGTVIWSSTPGFAGRAWGPTVELEEALEGELAIESGVVGVEDKPEHVAFAAQPGLRFVETYVPIWDEDRGGVVVVVEYYRQPRALFAAIDAGHRLIWLGALAGGAFLYLVLFGIVRRAGRVIRCQQERLATPRPSPRSAAWPRRSRAQHPQPPGLDPLLGRARAGGRPRAGARGGGRHRARGRPARRLAAPELLLYARADQPAEPGTTHLAAAVRAALDGLGPALARRGVALALELEDRLPSVPGGQAPLAHVVDTLVNNALDAMPGGGRLRVSARAGPGRREAELRIADTGEGCRASGCATASARSSPPSAAGSASAWRWPGRSSPGSAAPSSWRARPVAARS